MKLEVVKCICSEKTGSNSNFESNYDGMPHLQVTHNMDNWEAFCPNCGRGVIMQFKSAYLALKAWNAFQYGLHSNSWVSDFDPF